VDTGALSDRVNHIHLQILSFTLYLAVLPPTDDINAQECTKTNPGDVTAPFANSGMLAHQTNQPFNQ
jgi:hypothetical protein